MPRTVDSTSAACMPEIARRAPVAATWTRELLVVGIACALDQRMYVPTDIEKLVTGADMACMEQATLQ